MLIGGCWATVELIAALPDAYRRRRCLCGVSHVGHTWVSHTVVCCLRVRYGGRRQQESSLHRLRASHIIASGVDVRCTVTDCVRRCVATVSVSAMERLQLFNVYCVLLYVIACMLGLALT